MTDEQSALFEKADQTLQESIVLRDKELYNGAVSRAYYAMFNAATAALLNSPGKSFKRHSTVHIMFSEYWAKPGKIQPEYHRYLTSAFSARSKVDYFSRKFSTKEEADLHILHAEAFVHRVRQLLSNSESI